MMFSSNKIPLIILLPILLILILGVLGLSNLKKSKPSSTSLAPSNIPIVQKEFFCPVALSPCVGKKVYNSKNNFLGVGFETPDSTPVFATIQGEITFEPKIADQINEIATIVNKQKGYKASYNFIGNRLLNIPNELKGGQPIGSASAGSLFKNRGINVVVKLEDSSGKFLDLLPTDFQR